MNNLKEILVRYADFCMYMQENLNKPHKSEFIKYVSDNYGEIDRVVDDENASAFACKINSTVDETKLLEDPKNFKFIFEKYTVEMDGKVVEKNRVLVNKKSTMTRQIELNKILISIENKRKEKPKSIIAPEHQLLADWINWIDWSERQSLTLNLSNHYEAARDWLTSELHSWYDIYENVGVEVNEKNYISIWFEFDRSFDKQSLIDMKPDKSYDIKKRYNGYTMVEICITNK